MIVFPFQATFGMVININRYTVDTDVLEVYYSKNSDVVQFVCTLTSPGKSNCYWVGNYNIYAKQIQLISYHGGEIGATFG